MPAEFAELQQEESELAFNPTYMQDRPDKKERMWVVKHLSAFYSEEYITDVLFNVKGGKEATVCSQERRGRQR